MTKACMMKVLAKFLFLGSLFLLSSAHAGASTLLHTPDCDSLFLTSGKVILVKTLSWNDSTVHFTYCHDKLQVEHTAPWLQVTRIRKADGTELLSPLSPAAEPPLTEAEIGLEKEVESLTHLSKWIIPLTFLGGLGVFLSPLVMVRASKLMRKIKGHAHEAKLRKRIQNAKKRAMWLVGIYVFLGALFFWAVFSFFEKFEHM